ncbi:MAG: FxsA family protein [Gammaproteobacteria bacterium]|nr:FxsA family protein [Gammaproteobacteria bacterium]MDX2487523.1 FxsA family protein [Gammaproteobacteria bacterium]
MRGFPLGLLLFILAPIAELWLMIDIGSVIGAGWTVLAIIATAIIGASLVRFQGIGVYTRLNQTAARGEIPAMEMIEGMSLFISGVFLLIPGFITDAIGFLLLIPPLRRWFALNTLKRFFIVPNPSDPSAAGTHGENASIEVTTVEGEYRRIDK